MKLITVDIGSKKFGFPIGLIREILANYELTPVDRVDPDIAGLMNVRGQIVTVLKPNIPLSIEEPSGKEHNKVIVVKKNGELNQNEKSDFGQNGSSDDIYAFEVNGVDEVSEITESDLCAIPGNTPKEEARFLTSIARIGEDVRPVLNIYELIHIDSNKEE